MSFDYILKKGSLDYGIVNGDERIAFIKTGRGSSCFGENEKYLKMAKSLNSKYKCSVIVASNPNDELKNHIAEDTEAINVYTTKAKLNSPKLYLFGNSNGCIKGLELFESGFSFEKILLVNMPLMINPHRINRYLKGFNQTEIVAIFGEYDPSVSYVPFFKNKYQNIKVEIYPRADHNFSQLTDSFIALSDVLFNP